MKRQIDWPNHLLNFVSVILGVYLAFWVSEWAKSREDDAEKRIFLLSLSEELASDIQVYTKYQIPINTSHVENIDVLLEKIQEGDQQDITEQLAILFNLDNYAGSTSTYNSIKSSGKIALMTDLGLQKRLVDLYEGTMVEARYKGEFQLEYFSDQLLNWLTLHADLTSMQLNENISKTVLTNKLIIYQSLIAQKLEAYEMIVEAAKVLKDDIDKSL